MRAPDTVSNKIYYQELKSSLLTHNSSIEVSRNSEMGDRSCKRQYSPGRKLQFHTGLVECAIKQRAAVEGNSDLCYIPNSSSWKKKKRNYFSFLCNISMSSNLLLRYLNFYAIIHFPKRFCCLQPKADFRSKPPSLFPHDSRIQIYLAFSFLVCEIKQL